MPAKQLVAYVFLPLPRGCLLPAGWRCIFTERDLSAFDETDHEPNLFEVGVLERLTASVVMHRVDEPTVSQGLASATRAMERAFGWDQRGLLGESIPAVKRPRSVAEVMIPVTDEIPAETERVVREAIACCDAILGAYYLATQRAVETLDFRLLPPVLLVAFRMVEEGENEPHWPKSEDARIVPNFRSKAVEIGPELSETQLGWLSQATDFPKDGPFAPLTEVRRQMFAASTAGTVTRATLCGTACELLFRELLALMLWEEGHTPEVAAKTLSDRSISHLVRTQFSVRLGGDWSTTGRGPVATWFAAVASLRNRVVHVGYIPRAEEIDLALEAHSRLGRFIGDRLAVRINAYPLTAQRYLGESGLGRRGVNEKLKKRLEQDLTPTDLAAHFSRWRREVQRWAAGGPFVGNPQVAVLMLVIYIDGREQWWLMDENAGLCCLAKSPEGLDAHQRDGLKSLRVALAGRHPEREHVSIRFAGASALPLEHAPEWLPTGDAIPLNEYGRFACSLVPPASSKRP